MQESARLTSPWLFDRNADLLAFWGSTGAAFLLVGCFELLGALDDPIPVWLWLAAIVGVDVAHVHSTWFRTYLEPGESSRRPVLYFGTPLVVYSVGVLLHTRSPGLFWTVLAYLATFHFVRQPVGWMALYRARTGVFGPLDRWVDGLAIYAATLWPLLYWHAHLPRNFAWFLENDYLGPLPASYTEHTFPVYLAALGVFAVRQVWVGLQGQAPPWGRIGVVATTAASWYGGIVALDSDIAFTVTNVIPHGVPYLVLIWYSTRSHPIPERPGLTASLWRTGAWAMVGTLVLAAFSEELLWDKAVWHEHPNLFGSAFPIAGWIDWIVPLLAVPQATHYVLDGFIWRRGHRTGV